MHKKNKEYLKTVAEIADKIESLRLKLLDDDSIDEDDYNKETISIISDELDSMRLTLIEEVDFAIMNLLF